MAEKGCLIRHIMFQWFTCLPVGRRYEQELLFQIPYAYTWKKLNKSLLNAGYMIEQVCGEGPDNLRTPKIRQWSGFLNRRTGVWKEHLKKCSLRKGVI